MAMSATPNRFLCWAPRILSIVFAAFLCLFAADVFGGSRGFWRTALALVMHLIPVFILIAVIVFAWKRPWLAALFFPLLAVVHLVTMWGRLDWQGYVLIEGPLVLMGVLYLLSWRARKPVAAAGNERSS
jgi:hypothetical protein